MNVRTIVLVATLATALAGCGKKDEKAEEKKPSMDDKFAAFVKEIDALADEVKKKEAPEDAKKLFDERKAEISKKFDAIKDAGGSDVTEATKKKFEESLTSSMMAVCISSPDSCDEYTKLFSKD